MYCSLVLPYITYCVEVWGNTHKTKIHPIFLLQKKAIRIVNQKDYYAATNLLFTNLRTLKLVDRINLHTLIIMHKANNNQLPHCIQKLFEPRESQYNLRGICMFNKTKTRTHIKSRCTSMKGVSLWNNLDNDLKSCNQSI